MYPGIPFDYVCAGAEALSALIGFVMATVYMLFFLRG
jgi:hypothetical protein